MRWWFALLIPWATACNKDDDRDGERGQVTAEVTRELSFALDRSAADAGQDVGYTAIVVGSDGSTVEVYDAALSSDLEPELFHDADILVAKVAGTHGIDAVVTHEGETYSATATLEIGPGPAELVDLTLGAPMADAGEPLGFSVSAWDTWGNTIDAANAGISSDSTRVTIDGSTVRATEPGTYALTAVLGGAWDTEPFTVNAGPVASIELSLSTTDLELGETAVANVVLRDVEGNVTTGPYSLVVDGDDYVVKGDEITFLAEGWFSVEAIADGTGLSDSEGPFLIDSSGPIIDIDEPTRTTWDEVGEGAFTGTVTDPWSTIDTASLNGWALSLSSGGAFDVDVEYAWGLNVLETLARDTDGNESSDRRSVLSGDFLAYGDKALRGLEVRLDEGNGGLDVLEDVGADMVDPDMLAAAISNPVYSDTYSPCGGCGTWYALSIDIDSPDFDDATLDIDATSSGLMTTFSIYDAQLDYDADGVLLGIPYSTSGTITMTRVDIETDVDPYVLWSDIYVATSDPDVTIVGFDFPLASWAEDVLAFFGVDVDNIVTSYVETALESELEHTVAALFTDALSDFSIEADFPVGGLDFTLLSVPYSFDLDEAGVTLQLSTTFLAESWTIPHPDLGSLEGRFTSPDFSGLAGGTGLAINSDFVNQALLALWGGGVLSLEATDTDLGIDVEDLALVIPGLKDLTVTMDPLLPPVVVPASGASMGTLDFQLGDALLSFYDGDVDPKNLRLEMYVSAVAELDIDVTVDNYLAPSFGDVEVWVDVVYPATDDVLTESIVAGVVPTMLPTIGDYLGEIPLPSLSGFALDGVTVSTAGGDDAFVLLSGDLIAE